ncbi:MAG: leucine-rich repeat protein, partial [Muribaculaceae bacterium]|nr:leucine-rich repeat protein [Muribaculaceae bacterium]
GCKNITSLFLDNDNFANISAFNDSKTSVRNIYIGKSVSQINANAFSGCSNLLSATICENVSEIGNNAFAGCSKLNEVTNYSEYPQPINETVFSGVNVKACSLYVMENSYYYYSNVVYWKDFLVKITGVEGVEVDEPQKEIEGYYDLKGIRLEKPIRGQVNIVRYTDGSTKKLVVK